MAKGATMEDAFLLAEEKRRGVDSIITNNNVSNNWGEATTNGDNGDNSDVSDDDSFEDDFDDDDNAFMQKYRQERLDQLKQEQETKTASELLTHSVPSSILHIGRDDWKEEVNEESMDRWVVITLTDTSGDRRDRVVQELHRFAREFCPSTSGGVQGHDTSDSDNDDHPQNQARNNKSQQQRQQPRLLTIDASEAIPNWPADRVPAMFAYRDGVKQHEWIAGRRGEFPPREILEQLFRKWNVI